MLLDVCVIVIIAVFAFIGLKRGLMLSVLDMTSLLICIVASSLFAAKLSFIVTNLGVEDEFQAKSIAFIVLFILCCIGIMILRRFIQALHHLPIIRQLDSFGGLLIGLAQGFLLIFVIVILLHMFSSQSFFSHVIHAVEQTRIAKFFYDKNFIQIIMDHIS